MRASELHHLARVLRAIALDATGNTGGDRVNAGELAVLEDVALHPGSTVGDITRRTGLAQSLVSRIVRTVAAAGALTVEQNPDDRRKVAIELTASTRDAIVQRADTAITQALATRSTNLDAEERQILEHHLSQAAALLRRGTEGREPHQPAGGSTGDVVARKVSTSRRNSPTSKARDQAIPGGS